MTYIDEENIVLIVSPILFINANSSCHVDLLCTLHLSDIHPCRFCYWYEDDKQFIKSA